MTTDSILIVHSRRMTNCSYIKSYLEKIGILSEVAPTRRRIDCDSGDCRSDFGCSVQLQEVVDGGTLLKKVWNPLNDRYNFTSTRVYRRNK